MNGLENARRGKGGLRRDDKEGLLPPPALLGARRHPLQPPRNPIRLVCCLMVTSMHPPPPPFPRVLELPCSRLRSAYGGHVTCSNCRGHREGAAARGVTTLQFLEPARKTDVGAVQLGWETCRAKQAGAVTKQADM